MGAPRNLPCRDAPLRQPVLATTDDDELQLQRRRQVEPPLSLNEENLTPPS
jgi:hypothetical protein